VSEAASRSWESAVSEQSIWIEDLLETSPSLQRDLAAFMQKAYPRARRAAAK
jgi:hypothetical protein